MCMELALENAVAWPGRMVTVRERSKCGDTNANEAGGYLRCAVDI